MAKFRTSLSIFGLASAASEALGVRVNNDTEPRIKIDAGGRITWGDGASTGDVWMARTGAEVLTINKSLVVSGGLSTLAGAGTPSAPLADGGLAVNTNDDSFFFRSNGAWFGVPTALDEPVKFDVSSPLDGQLMQYDSVSDTWFDGIRVTYGDTPPSSPNPGDIWLDTSE